MSESGLSWGEDCGVRRWLGCLLLLTGCLFVYWQVPEAGFVSFDDDANFVYNENLGPLNAARMEWILTEHTVMVRYVPVGWLLCCALTGINGLDPFWFHATSAVLHAASCVAFFLLLRKIAELWDRHERGPWSGLLPLLIAAWWGWHPLRVETVAWATTLIYVQATLLGLLSLCLLPRETETTVGRAVMMRAGSFVLLCAALLSHPAAICLLPLHMILELLLRPAPAGGPGPWRDRAWQRGMLLRVTPAVLAVTVILAVTMAVRQMGSLVPRTGTPSLEEFGLLERVAQGSATLVHFLVKTLWPAELSPAYPLLLEVQPMAPLFLGSMLACLGLAAVCVRALTRHSRTGLLALGSLAACAPFLGLQEHPYYPCDRYTQLPSLLLGCLLLTVGLGAGRAEGSPRVLASAGARCRAWLSANALVLLLAACLPAWLLVSREQTRIWRDDDTLHAALVAGQDSALLRDAYLARGLLKQLQHGQRGRVHERLEQLRKSGPPGPEFLGVENELAAAEATQWVSPFVHLLQGQALKAAREGELDLSKERLRRALRIAPHFARARYTLCLILSGEGQADEALAQLHWVRVHRGDLQQEHLERLHKALAASYRAAGREEQARRTEKLVRDIQGF